MKKTAFLQHDNAQPHTARLILENGWKVLPHTPYLAPLDYHLLKALKDRKRGQHYENNNAVQEAMCWNGFLLQWGL
jgi:hypothetical protein